MHRSLRLARVQGCRTAVPWLDISNTSHSVPSPFAIAGSCCRLSIFPSSSVPGKSASADLLPAMAVACSRHRSPLALYLHSFPNAFSCFRRSYPFWQGRPRRNGSGASSACYFTRGAGASGAGAGAGASAFFSGSKKMAFTNTFTSTTRRPVMVSMAFLTSCWTFLATSWIR